VKPEFRRSNVPKAPGVNPVPIIVAIFILAGIGIFALQSSWVGQLMTKGPAPEDPMEKLTMVDARNTIENGLKQGFAAVGAKATIKYTAGGAAATKITQGPVEMTVDTELADPNARKGIIDPIKEYMDKAQIPTLTVNDSKSHATWTYSCALSPPPKGDDSGLPPQQPQAQQDTQQDTQQQQQ